MATVMVIISGFIFFIITIIIIVVIFQLFSKNKKELPSFAIVKQKLITSGFTMTDITSNYPNNPDASCVYHFKDANNIEILYCKLHGSGVSIAKDFISKEEDPMFWQSIEMAEENPTIGLHNMESFNPKIYTACYKIEFTLVLLKAPYENRDLAKKILTDIGYR